MSVRTVFRPERSWHGTKLTCDNTAGELIDQLIGICFAKPPYLRKADAMRYVSLLNELKQFECFDLSPQGNNKTLAKNIPIRRLPFVLEQWVNSYFGEDYHRMMPAYALDTGRLIEHHVEGSYQSDWYLEGIVEAGEDLWRRGMFESSFRRRFTTQFGGLQVVCRVPDTEHSIDQPKWIETLNPRDQFLVRIERCHLSGSWASGLDVVCQDTDLECDLMSEFCFGAELLVRKNTSTDFNALTPGAFTAVSRGSEATHKFSASVPARWITHALIWRNEEEVLLPVPRWKTDDVELISTKVQ